MAPATTSPEVNGNSTSVIGLASVKDDFIQIPEVHLLPRGSLMFARLTLVKAASYPTGSLDFLARLKKQEQKQRLATKAPDLINDGELSRLRLKIIIVGAGLGGLAAAISLARRGHNVTVFEQAPALGEVCGRPFQFSPRALCSPLLLLH